MAEDMCGPSNAAKGLARHMEQDRSLQHELRPGQSANQPLHPNNIHRATPTQDTQFGAFEAGHASLSHPTYNAGSPAIQHPNHHVHNSMRFNPSTNTPAFPSSIPDVGPSNWIQDFQRMGFESHGQSHASLTPQGQRYPLLGHDPFNGARQAPVFPPQLPFANALSPHQSLFGGSSVPQPSADPSAEFDNAFHDWMATMATEPSASVQPLPSTLETHASEPDQEATAVRNETPLNLPYEQWDFDQIIKERQQQLNSSHVAEPEGTSNIHIIPERDLVRLILAVRSRSRNDPRLTTADLPFQPPDVADTVEIKLLKALGSIWRARNPELLNHPDKLTKQYSLMAAASLRYRPNGYIQNLLQRGLAVMEKAIASRGDSMLTENELQQRSITELQEALGRVFFPENPLAVPKNPLSMDRSANDSDLATAARQILDAVSDNESDKFNNSGFLQMMKRIAALELVVRDNALVDSEAVATSDAGNQRVMG